MTTEEGLRETRGSGTATLPLRGSVADACAACADRLVAAVTELPGVTGATVSPVTASLRVAFDPERLTAEAVAAVVDAAADRLSREFGHRTYQIRGMDCANCALSVEKSVAAVPGVVSASVNFPAARMHVEHAARSEAEVAALIERRVRDLGFTLARSDGEVSADAPGTGGQEDLHGQEAARRRDVARVAVSGALLLLGVVLENVPALHAPLPAALTHAVFAASILAGGYRFALAGLRALRTRTVGTNLLMALAAVGAVGIGEWDDAAGVVFLYAVGEMLEGIAMERTRRSLAALIEAAPAEALVQREGSLTPETIPAAKLRVGDVLVVRPGAKVAADGVIVSGESALVEAAVTGESLPRDKRRGDDVFAGSLNGNGNLLVRVTAPASDSTLARILNLVEAAQARKAPAQALVERFGRVYTPVVIAASVLLAVLGPLFAPGVDWVYRALTLLVVACPCALVIATPVAYVSGIARAARSGVLVKGGAYLEALAGSRRVALDKTGTLTTGRPALAEILPAAGVVENDLLAVAAAAERYSDHPIAAAVVREAERRGLPEVAAERAAAVPGRGVTATVGGEPVLVGTADLLAERGVRVPAEIAAAAERLAARGGTTLLVARGGAVLGVLGVADAHRPEAAEAVAALKGLGLAPVILTGDGDGAARRVGEAVRVSDVRARLLPEDKLSAVREMTARGDRPAFVGDGINDAPALAAAAVGVAMGTGGTAAALEAADIALMESDLSRLPWAVRLARATRAVVRQNVVIALGTVAVLLVATFLGRLALPVGVVGHEASALLVILNGLRLLSPRLTNLDETGKRLGRAARG